MPVLYTSKNLRVAPQYNKLQCFTANFSQNSTVFLACKVTKNQRI